MRSLRPVVKPSEVHTYAYCPRLYFFEIHSGRHRGPRERLRMLLGAILHRVLGVALRLRGYRVEEPLSAELGGVRVVGRADAVRIEDGAVSVVERKSGRAPRRGAWASDVLQAAVYAILALRAEGASRATLRLEYRNGSRVYELGDDLVSAALRAVDEVVLVKYHGIVPYANRGPRRCARCPFRGPCEELDRGLEDVGEVYEPGAWLGGLSLIPPGRGGATGADRGPGHGGRRPDTREGPGDL